MKMMKGWLVLSFVKQLYSNMGATQTESDNILLSKDFYDLHKMARSTGGDNIINKNENIVRLSTAFYRCLSNQ